MSTGKPGNPVEQTLTVLAPKVAPSSSAKPKIAMREGSGPCYTDELNVLLRSRLRIAVLIGLAGFSLFLIKVVFFPANVGPQMQASATDKAVHTAVVALQTLLCGILWSNLCLCQRTLRAIELAFFGSAAFFFAYLQMVTYQHGNCLVGISDENVERVLQLQNMATLIRWYVLIVLYGTFIPNTWKRSSIVIGAFVATPLILTFGVFFPCPVMGRHVFSSMFDMSVTLSLAAATAIFGSYKISELQQEAYKMRKLGQYQLHRRLGQGGMGEVYLGEHTLLRRSCAIKLIRPDFAGDPTTLSRFEREVQAMATLTHWNTVEVYDYGRTDDGTFYYVMEYLPGLSLQELVEQNGPLPPGRAIYFLRQLCAALREAHGIGLIHRDLKPSNVIVCQRGQVYDVAKLLDFGLVHETGIKGDGQSKLTMQGTILGSPQFIAPEQAKGFTNVDARTDIYALGALGYFLVTGQSPFQRETVMELLAAHISDTPTPPRSHRPEIPTDLEEILMRCLRKKPDDRFANVADLDRALADSVSSTEWDADLAEDWWKGHADRSTNETKNSEAMPTVLSFEPHSEKEPALVGS